MQFDYNTSRSKLILPEYGRNIHEMVDHVKQITDREERNRAALSVISVMGNLNPHLRDIADFKHKLWDHLAIIANFDLDIDWPYPLPTVEVLNEPPARVPYNQHRIKYKHYGKNNEDIIKKAAEFEDGEEKNALIALMANQLKKSYLMWNREAVADEDIFKDFTILSEGKIKLETAIKLTETQEILRTKRPVNTTSNTNNNNRNQHHQFHIRSKKK